jgi:hypothetical protein
MTPTTPNDLSALGFLVLARLLTAGDKAQRLAQIKKDLEPLVEHRWSGAALTDQIERTIAELESIGLVTTVRGRSKKAAPKVVLTEHGRRRGLDALGVAELKPKTTWTVLKKAYLPAHALGLSASSDAVIKALSSDPGFKAILLRKEFQLPLADCPTMKAATGAVAWKLMGFSSTKVFSVAEVQKSLLERELGDQRPANSKKAIDRLLAQRLGARRDDSKELRDALLRGWIDREEGGLGVNDRAATCVRPPAPAPASAAQPPAPPPAPVLDLQSFAERVKATARTCPSGRFGDNKVFIAHVWRALQSDPAFRAMDLAAFKGRLAEANNTRLLDLSRADLVQAMDPNDVYQSEVHYLNATFHFVRI